MTGYPHSQKDHKMKDFISLLDYSHDQLTHILDRADTLYDQWQQNQLPQFLANKRVGLWFYGNGFRNRLAFEIGVKSLGGRASYIPGELGKHEPLEDIGPYLENWYSMIVVRAANHSDLIYLADSISIPVINARTNLGHPCEIMGDLQFIRRQRGTLADLHVAFVGETTNLYMSWLEASVRLPIRLTQIAPADYLASEALVTTYNAQAIGHADTTTELDAALDDVDIIYTDCWPKSGHAEVRDAIKTSFLPYQITGSHVAALKGGAMFLPCPPVTRGEEVSQEAMRSPRCMNHQAKAFLLHSQNAIMEMLAAKI
jgi:ornithine carbamoyltransferase